MALVTGDERDFADIIERAAMVVARTDDSRTGVGGFAVTEIALHHCCLASSDSGGMA
jgi:hypothetical protein